jgi:hypothetical protein
MYARVYPTLTGLVLASLVAGVYRYPAAVAPFAEAARARSLRPLVAQGENGPRHPPGGPLPAKRELGTLLLEGRLTLTEAAARWQRLEYQDRGSSPTSGAAPSAGERLCRIMIDVVWEVSLNRGQPPGTVVARLEAELEAARGPDGVVHVPDIGE